MKRDVEKILYKSGLSEKESQIYSFLLHNGANTATVISERTDITRPSVYRILLDLSIKGLVEEITRGKKKLFFIDSVDRLQSWKKDNIKYVQRQSDLLDRNLSSLRDILSISKNSIHARYFNDEDGLREIYNDHLMYSNYEMIGFSDIEKITKFLGEDFLKKYIKKKRKLNIRSRGIITQSDFSQGYRNEFYGKYTLDKDIQIKFAHENFPINFGSEIILYGGSKISLIDTSHKTLSGVIIENKGLYNTLKSIFEMSWFNL